MAHLSVDVTISQVDKKRQAALVGARRGPLLSLLASGCWARHPDRFWLLLGPHAARGAARSHSADAPSSQNKRPGNKNVVSGACMAQATR